MESKNETPPDNIMLFQPEARQSIPVDDLVITPSPSLPETYHDPLVDPPAEIAELSTGSPFHIN